MRLPFQELTIVNMTYWYILVLRLCPLMEQPAGQALGRVDSMTARARWTTSRRPFWQYLGTRTVRAALPVMESGYERKVRFQDHAVDMLLDPGSLVEGVRHLEKLRNVSVRTRAFWAIPPSWLGKFLADFAHVQGAVFSQAAVSKLQVRTQKGPVASCVQKERNP